jgi:hypothetical protein
MNTWTWIVTGAIIGSASHAALIYTHGTGRYESVGVLAAPGAGMNVRITAGSPTGWGEETTRALQRRHGATERDLKPVESGEGYPQPVWAGVENITDGTMNIRGFARSPEQAQAMATDVMNLIRSKAEPYWELKLVAAPTLPAAPEPWGIGHVYASRWRLSRLIGLGTLAGAASALVIVLLGKGWRRLAAKT